MDLSVIVTVYNKEKYLSRCLESLLRQRFSGEFEVIAVDDASTDRSPAILRDYVKSEPRLRLITLPENRKQAYAREAGMKAATGDFIMHVDSDDWLLPGAFERLLGKFRETDADVLTFNYIRSYADGSTFHPKVIEHEFVTRDKGEVIGYFLGGAGTRVVRRELTQGLLASGAGITTTEDLLYDVEILLRSSAVCLIPDEFYVYYVNRESVTWTTTSSVYLQNQVVVLRLLDNILAQHERDFRLVKAVLSFIEKWIFIVLAEAQFVRREHHEMVDGLQEAFGLYPEVSKKDLRRLRAAFRSRYMCLLQVMRCAGIRSALGIAYRGLKARMQGTV